VLAVDSANADAKRLQGAGFDELGERQMSANAGNSYLSVAQYLLRDLPPR
jgi:alkyl sulfatase BDS1-like metallo-beta-lactamase superfamily hydrolase